MVLLLPRRDAALRAALVVAVVLAAASPGAAKPVRFDQRQNGSLNVQVDLKDLEVYAIVEDEQLEGAMIQAAQAAETVRPRPNAAVVESLEVLKGAGGVVDAAPSPPPAASASAAANSPAANAPRRPNDKLASIKHKTGGLLPHERSDSASALDLPLWVAAAPRDEEHDGDGHGGDEELEPRATTAVEARAAPASAAPTAPVSAGVGPSGRPAQSQGVRPVGTVSVAHLHCGQGYYRDQSGRCRRSRRPQSSNTRKHHHHHGNRKHRPAAKPVAPAVAPTPTQAPEQTKNAVKDAAKVAAKEPAVKEAVKVAAPKDPVPKDAVVKAPVKEAVKEASKDPISGVASEDAVPAAAPIPAPSVSSVKTATREPVKEPVKTVAKDAVKDSLKEASKEPVHAHKGHPVKHAAVKEPSKDAVKVVAVKTPISVQDRIAASFNNKANIKEAAKTPDVKPAVKVPVKPQLHRHSQQQLKQQQAKQPLKPAPVAAVKDKEAAKVSVAHHHSHHSQHSAHKITVIKDDNKPRTPPPASNKPTGKVPAPVPVPAPAVVAAPVVAAAPAPAAPASPTIPAKKA